MKIIISPAKKMNVDTDTFAHSGLPEFLSDAERLCHYIQSLSYEEVKALWKCNDKLAELNFRRFAQMDLRKGLTPAIFSYEGLQYQHMAPMVMTEKALDYLKEHLRILSGFYGVLRPFDGVTPYRLEMQAALSVDGKKNLYEFWGSRLYQAVADPVILNLASKEYARAVAPYVSKQDRFITVEFGKLSEGKVKQEGTAAKMARGAMVRYLAEHQVGDAEGVKDFCEDGYGFDESRSTKEMFVFLK